MKLDAIGVCSSNLNKTVEFYTLLGFKFPEYKADDSHLEAITAEGDTRLMIDSKKLISEIMGEEPKPSNHSAFALLYNSPEEVDDISANVSKAGFAVVKEPWDAFWGQRYAIVEDPDGYKVDLFAGLPK